MPSDGFQRDLGPSFFARLGAAARYAVSGTAPESWFGPQKPLEPQAPPEVKGRQWDYPFGANLSYTPRSEAAISFAELRALADALPLLRLLIETRKDQIAGLSYTVRSRDPRGNSAAAPRIASTLAFLARPDRHHGFATWLRLWLEDMLVIDAVSLYPRYTLGGELYAIDVIDGSTITPLIAEDGRTPEPPDPAYQQVLHGVPAADFLADELIYLPRNPRPQRLYGMSPVEQVALTINIALRRDMATLDYYRLGSTPDAFATLPKDWTLDQIRQFQDHFDALMSGNLARRRMVKFMPSEFKLIETRQPPLKDQYDEWLARVICYAFAIPPSPFVAQVNRATSETMRMQSAQEGLVPLKAWVKSVLDAIVQGCLKQPDLEFAWVGDDAVDPLQQAQTLSLLVSAGIKTREEARADLGLAPEMAGTPPAGGGAGIAKYNHNHDERGQFSTAEDAVAQDGGVPSGSKPERIQITSNDTLTTGTMTDLSMEANSNSARTEVRRDDASIVDDGPLNEYHNQVLREELDRYRRAGSTCISEVNLTFSGITSRLDILCVTPSAIILGAEVKTGDNPRLSAAQRFVDTHVILGAGVTSPDAKIGQLGLQVNALLPAIPIWVVWARAPGEPKRYLLPQPEPLNLWTRNLPHSPLFDREYDGSIKLCANSFSHT